MSGAVLTPWACRGQGRWLWDNTHRPWASFGGSGRCWGWGGPGTTLGTELWRQPRVPGVGPEGSGAVPGTLLNAEATKPGQIALSTSPAGGGHRCPGGGGSTDTKALWGLGLRFCLGLGQRSKGGLCLNLTSQHSERPLHLSVAGPRGLVVSP